MAAVDPHDLAGCCGLYCGLCPKFQSTAKSRCLGCHLGEQHSYCSVYRCCVAKLGFRTCAECEDYPCDRLVRVLGIEEGLDSFVSHKPAVPNLDRIREAGSDTYLLEQEERRSLLGQLMGRYNEGRSMSFYCRTCALLSPEAVRRIVADAQRGSLEAPGDDEDVRARAKAMRAAITEEAGRLGVDLKLRAKRK